MTHGSIEHFAGRTANSTSALSDSLLRADRPASSRTAVEWAETLRFHGTLPAGNYSACASARFYLERNPSPFLRFPRYHSRFGALANAFPKKACGVGSADGWNKSGARLTREAEDEMQMRHLGSMWQGDIPEHERRCST